MALENPSIANLGIQEPIDYGISNTETSDVDVSQKLDKLEVQSQTTNNSLNEVYSEIQALRSDAINTDSGADSSGDPISEFITSSNEEQSLDTDELEQAIKENTDAVNSLNELFRTKELGSGAQNYDESAARAEEAMLDKENTAAGIISSMGDAQGGGTTGGSNPNGNEPAPEKKEFGLMDMALMGGSALAVGALNWGKGWWKGRDKEEKDADTGYSLGLKEGQTVNAKKAEMAEKEPKSAWEKVKSFFGGDEEDEEEAKDTSGDSSSESAATMAPEKAEENNYVTIGRELNSSSQIKSDDGQITGESNTRSETNYTIRKEEYEKLKSDGKSDAEILEKKELDLAKSLSANIVKQGKERIDKEQSSRRQIDKLQELKKDAERGGYPEVVKVYEEAIKEIKEYEKPKTIAQGVKDFFGVDKDRGGEFKSGGAEGGEDLFENKPEKAEGSSSESAATMAPEKAEDSSSQSAATMAPEKAEDSSSQSVIAMAPEKPEDSSAATMAPEKAEGSSSESAATMAPEKAEEQENKNAAQVERWSKEVIERAEGIRAGKFKDIYTAMKHNSFILKVMDEVDPAAAKETREKAHEIIFGDLPSRVPSENQQPEGTLDNNFMGANNMETLSQNKAIYEQQSKKQDMQSAAVINSGGNKNTTVINNNTSSNNSVPSNFSVPTEQIKQIT